MIGYSGSPWFMGKYGFVLRDPIVFEHPTPWKGRLGFFEGPDCVQVNNEVTQ